MRTTKSGRLYPDRQEYQRNVIRRLKEATTALEGLAAYDMIVDGQLAADADALLDEAHRTKRRLALASPHLSEKQYDEASDRLALLDAAMEELATLLEGRLRRATPHEEGHDND